MIETENLLLRNFLYSDKNDFYEYITQREVRYNSLCETPNFEEVALMFNFVIEEKYTFAIYLKSEKKVIGEISLSKPDKDEIPDFFYSKNIMDISIQISKYYWQKGYGSEAYSSLIKYAKCFLKLDGLIASYFEFNKSSFLLHKKFCFNFWKKISYNKKIYENIVNSNLIITYLEF